MDLKIRVFLSLVVLAIVVRDGKGKELTPDPLTGLSPFVEIFCCCFFVCDVTCWARDGNNLAFETSHYLKDSQPRWQIKSLTFEICFFVELINVSCNSQTNKKKVRKKKLWQGEQFSGRLVAGISLIYDNFIPYYINVSANSEWRHKRLNRNSSFNLASRVAKFQQSNLFMPSVCAMILWTHADAMNFIPSHWNARL